MGLSIGTGTTTLAAARKPAGEKADQGDIAASDLMTTGITVSAISMLGAVAFGNVPFARDLGFMFAGVGAVLAGAGYLARRD